MTIPDLPEGPAGDLARRLYAIRNGIVNGMTGLAKGMTLGTATDEEIQGKRR